MSPEDADSIVRKAASAGEGSSWAAYDQGLTPYRQWTDFIKWETSAQTVEYVFVRDDKRIGTLSLDSLTSEARARGDLETAARYEKEARLASDLGLSNLAVVQALPTILGAVGFTRYFSNPNDTAGSGNDTARVELRPFPPINSQIPIYVARNTTEALLYDLDPFRLAAFLVLNSGVTIPTECKSLPSLKAWLLQQAVPLFSNRESHFVLKEWELENGVHVDVTSALLFGVLHTLSHVLKATAHKHVGIDGDSLAEYLFPGHAAGLLYVSTMVDFTLGGIDSDFRSNLSQWLGSAWEYAGRCSFDPVCQQGGGACHACLYPKFGCSAFNRTVSRAFLVGGDIRGFGQPLLGFWTQSVIDAGEQLRNRMTPSP
jgi:hypothetical protein